MKAIDKTQLDHVAGGKSDQLAGALQQVQSSLQNLTPNNSNTGNSTNNLLLPMMMMVMNRPQPTVIATGAPAASYVQGGSVINITNRWRRW